MGAMANRESAVRVRRLTVFGVVLGVLLVAACVAAPWLTVFTTHSYADSRPALGVPNFQNVMSNLAFLLAGVLGLAHRARAAPAPARAAWWVFYAGMVLTACGSAWHHLAPSDATLLWDRLGMVVAFVGLLAAVIAESTAVRLGAAWLVPAVALGAASVLWWRLSGNLGVYAWVQLAPLAAVVTALAGGWLAPAMRTALLASLACYVLAKFAETFDARIYLTSGHLTSGHTLKHLLAAAAAFAILAAQRAGTPAAPHTSATSPGRAAPFR
jgi:hypothetical protein